jgi:hypothetical protein
MGKGFPFLYTLSPDQDRKVFDPAFSPGYLQVNGNIWITILVSLVFQVYQIIQVIEECPLLES